MEHQDETSKWGSRFRSETTFFALFLVVSLLLHASLLKLWQRNPDDAALSRIAVFVVDAVPDEGRVRVRARREQSSQPKSAPSVAASGSDQPARGDDRASTHAAAGDSTTVDRVSSDDDTRLLSVEYPRSSRLLGEEGDVVYEISLDTEGRIIAYKRVESSKIVRLDEAAERAMKKALAEKSLAFPREIRRVKFSFRLD
jgi:TonB family protein